MYCKKLAQECGLESVASIDLELRFLFSENQRYGIVSLRVKMEPEPLIDVQSLYGVPSRPPLDLFRPQS